MRFEIRFRESFFFDLMRAPNKVQKQAKRAFDQIRERGDSLTGNTMKPLSGYENLWRYRIGSSYRLIYEIRTHTKPPTVVLTALGDRKEIYERFDLLGKGEVWELEDSELDLAPTPPVAQETPQPIELAELDHETLPVVLSEELLLRWGVSQEDREKLIGVDSVDPLLNILTELDDRTGQLVLAHLFPPDVETLLQEPVRVVAESQDLIEAVESARPLHSFLLELDEPQKEFVSRFRGGQSKGPWLLKGGPGTGKTIVALHAIREILADEERRLSLEEPINILFATFANSLKSSARVLLDEMLPEDQAKRVDVTTVDALANELTGGVGRHVRGNGESDVISAASLAYLEVQKRGGIPSFSKQDIRFLIEETNEVIWGRGVSTLDEYLQIERVGRGSALQDGQRKQVWAFFEAFHTQLHKRGIWLFSDAQLRASGQAKPSYDFVFVDEAQDLKPAAIRLCVALAKDPSRIFVTADTNQSIYSGGITWSSVAEELKFTGRTTILRRSYRTTKSIWGAASQLAPSAADAETLEIEVTRKGPLPQLHWYAEKSEWPAILNRALVASMREAGVGPDSVAVLCRSRTEANWLAGALDPVFRAAAMRSKNLDIDHPGAKVMTMHAAKGLEFPVVAVVGVEEGNLPGVAHPPEAVERDRRLLFVACTRATNRLHVLASRSRPSAFLKGLDHENWGIRA